MATRARQLGSIIADYKFKYRNKEMPYDIHETIKRLEGYKNYQIQMQKERRVHVEKEERKTIRKIKKMSYRKLYSHRPINNPYVTMYLKLHPNVDPKLYERYKSKHLFSLSEFRHLKLPKSNHTIQAGFAWNGLINSWKGYKISMNKKDHERAVRYASATQKWSWMLETPLMGDFPHLNLTKEGFNSAPLLKKYFGKMDEMIGDEL